jgi:hypothetical protein
LADEDITKTVEHHDDPKYFPEGTEEFKIVFGSIYDADHLRFCLEREKDFWEMKQSKGSFPEDVITDFKWLPDYQDAWKTGFGKSNHH